MDSAWDTAQSSDAPPVNKGKAVDNKPPEAVFDDDETEHDESMDTSSRQSTRLVKFQLFETKAVSSPLICIHAYPSAFISSDLIKTRLIIVSSKSIELSSREN
jgi:hypothetical protein